MMYQEHFQLPIHSVDANPWPHYKSYLCELPQRLMAAFTFSSEVMLL